MFFTIPTLLTWARIIAIPLVVGVFYLPLDGPTRNLLATACNFGQCGQTNVGQTKVCRQDSTRDIDTIKAFALDELGRERVERPGELQKFT